MKNDNKTTTTPSLIGHRFGKLHVVEKIEGTSRYKCVCDCGETVIAPQGQLLHYNKLSCGKCNISYAEVCEQYGELSDYFDLNRVCVFCGSPFVYSKRHQLCRNCYHRLIRTGTVEYKRDASSSISPEERKEMRKAESKQRKETRRKILAAEITPCPREDALMMAELFVNQGKTYSEIGKIFGVSRQRVHQLLHWPYNKTKEDK